MKPALSQGATHSLLKVVDETMTVPYGRGDYPLFADMPKVLATASLVTFIEAACAEALAPHLEENEVSLGTVIDITHSAPTPIGATIRAEVTVIKVEPETVSFAVTVLDDEDVVSVGTHTRGVVQRHHVEQKVSDKAQRLRIKS